MPRSTPNILWFSFEDTSPRFGVLGDPVARKQGLTPHVDRLGAEGRLFRNAFSTAPVCAPSRFAVITGVYAHAAGAGHMRTIHTNAATPEMCTPYEVVPPSEVKCVSEYLRAAGYYCTNNSKTDYQFSPPKSAWDECSSTAHWRNRPDPTQPFFAVFNFGATHESGMWEDKGPPRTDPRGVEVPPYLVDGPLTRQAIARQYDHVADGDAALGELLAQLLEDQLLDNTIVFVWSDHGEGLPRRKRWPLDGGTRVPMVVWAGEKAKECLASDERSPAIVDDLVSLIDLPPTVLSLAGLPVPTHLHGQPFLGPRRGKAREWVLATRDRFDESPDRIRSIRDARWRYVRNVRPDLPYLLWIPYSFRHPAMHELWHAHLDGTLTPAQQLLFKNQRPPEELYDTSVDPHEINNLADDPGHAAELARLRRLLDEQLERFGDLHREDESQMVRRFWPDGKQPKTAPVVFVAITPTRPGVQPASSGTDEPIELDAPARLLLHSATQGASLVYSVAGRDDRWRLYTGPIALSEGESTIRAIAHRYGYAESDEKRVRVRVKPPAPRERWQMALPSGPALSAAPPSVAPNIIAGR